jgi:DnaK suppressor protein
MTRTELDNFQRILTTKQAELARGTGKRDGIAIERTPDALDEVLFAAERELTTLGLERESRLLRNVRAALGRIAEGTYGTCIECDEEISQKRLHAVPWAAFCIACQERSDRDSQGRFGARERFLKEAA